MGDDVQSEGLARVLEGIEVAATSAHSLSLAMMLRAWTGDVRRFIGGLCSTPIRDGDSWGADDCIAALTMRSRIEETRTRVPAESQAEFDRWLGEIDSEYRGFTETDDRGLLADWIHGEVPGGQGCHRVPRSGPVRRELGQS